MELSYLETIEILKTKLENSIKTGDINEKQAIINKLKKACLDFKLDSTCTNSSIITFNNLHCKKDCEECIIKGNSYFMSYIIEDSL